MGLFSNKKTKNKTEEPQDQILQYWENKKSEIDQMRDGLHAEQKEWEERKNTTLLEEIKKRGWKVIIGERM